MPQLKTNTVSFGTSSILRAVLVLNLVALLGCGGGDSDSGGGGGCGGDDGSIAFVADQSTYDFCIQATDADLCNVDLSLDLLFELCDGTLSDIQEVDLTTSNVPCDVARASVDAAISSLDVDGLPTGGTYTIQDDTALTCFGLTRPNPYAPCSFDLEGQQTVTVDFARGCS